MLNGVEVPLPVRDSDSLHTKVEALKVYLGQQLGADTFQRWAGFRASVSDGQMMQRPVLSIQAYCSCARFHCWLIGQRCEHQRCSKTCSACLAATC